MASTLFLLPLFHLSPRDFKCRQQKSKKKVLSLKSKSVPLSLITHANYDPAYFKDRRLGFFEGAIYERGCVGTRTVKSSAIVT